MKTFSEGDMVRAQIEFFDEIPIDERHTLHQLLGRFQTVVDGLPELVKNAKDQYARRGVIGAHRRPVVVLVSSRARRVGVLDFAGARREDFAHWVVWSDPKASRIGASADIEGRHGNGGKGFMVRGSTDVAWLESVTDGLRTKMGFQNDTDAVQYYPGTFIEEGERVLDLPVDDVEAALNTALADFELELDDLPDGALQVFENQHRFTLARVDGVRDWVDQPQKVVNEMAAKMAQDLRHHAQTALTLETCSVYVMIDGRRPIGPLERELPEPMEGFEKPWRIRIPETLVDPQTSAEVETGGGTKREKYLHIYSSARSLRMPGKRPLNVVRVLNARNILASWSVADLYPHAESAYVFGELRVPALELDHIAGADRHALADTALIRALRAWVGDEIGEVCREIQKAMAEDYGPTDRRKVNRELSQFRNLMESFLTGRVRRGPIPNLDTDDSGEALADDDSADEQAATPSPSPATTARSVAAQVVAQMQQAASELRASSGSSGQTGRFELDSIELEPGRDRITVAAGTHIPLVVYAYEVNELGTRRRAPGLKLELLDGGSLVHYDSSARTLQAREPGEVEVTLRHRSSGTRSEPLTLEVVACQSARFEDVPNRVLEQGERVPLSVVMETDAGPRRDVLVQASLDEPRMGRVDRDARFTAGRYVGEAVVRLRYGPGEDQTLTAELEIGDTIATERPVRRVQGGHIPHILVCGSPAPGMQHFPPAQRTLQGGSHEPTIIDFEPQFEHVIWINPSSEESVRVREGRGSTRGVAGIGSKAYLRFLAIKCFEILKRLYVRQRVQDRLLSEAEFRRLFAQAEIACAPFVDSAYIVAESLNRK